MTRETVPPPVANEDPTEPRAKRETNGLTESKKALLKALAGFLATLTVVVPTWISYVTSHEARDAAKQTALKVDQTAVQTREVAVAANSAEDVAKANARQLEEQARQMEARHREQLEAMRVTIVELARSCGLSRGQAKKLHAKVEKAAEAAREAAPPPTQQENP